MRQNNQTVEKKHSRLGIASVVIGIALPVLLILFVVSSIFLGTRKNTTGNDIVVALLATSLTFPLLHLLALVFGIIGLASRKTKKLFPAIGTALNAILLLAGAFIIYFTASSIYVGH